MLQMKKAVELSEQLRQRMGVVVVGPSGAGKSTLWRMLRAALGKMGKVVSTHTHTPAAATHTHCCPAHRRTR